MKVNPPSYTIQLTAIEAKRMALAIDDGISLNPDGYGADTKRMLEEIAKQLHDLNASCRPSEQA